MYNLGNALQFQAKYDEAMALHRQSLSVRELQGQQPKIAQSVARVAEVHYVPYLSHISNI